LDDDELEVFLLSDLFSVLELVLSFESPFSSELVLLSLLNRLALEDERLSVE
jgi:hypothetical protein